MGMFPHSLASEYLQRTASQHDQAKTLPHELTDNDQRNTGRRINCLSQQEQTFNTDEKRKDAGLYMRALSVALSYLLCIQCVLPSAYAQNPPVRLDIVVVSGEGAINNVGQRSSRDPVVRIEDENNKPVVGASVVFTLPTEGPSGVFANGDKTAITVTDNRGEAAATGLRLNTVAGKLQIHVNASFRGQTARTNITQFNMEVPGKQAKGSGKLVAILAIVGAAAAGGAVAATRGSSSAATPPTTPAAPPAITIAPGTGTVGPPR
jgi:hypothetical protein